MTKTDLYYWGNIGAIREHSVWPDIVLHYTDPNIIYLIFWEYFLFGSKLPDKKISLTIVTDVKW